MNGCNCPYVKRREPKPGARALFDSSSTVVKKKKMPPSRLATVMRRRRERRWGMKQERNDGK
jgi:hypothetical protein